MEKDYFKDRPIESTKINYVHLGQKVFICEKKRPKICKKIK